MPTTSVATKSRVPRYQIAEQGVLDRISSGAYQIGQRLAGVNDLADDFGVSPSTMRQSLQSLAAKGILECVPGRGTSVSSDAMRLIGQPTKPSPSQAYSLIIPDIRYLEFSTLAHSVQEAARVHQFGLTISNTEDDVDRYVEELDRTIQSGARGIVVVPPLRGSLPLKALTMLSESGIPVVSCYRPIELIAAPTIRQDIFATQRRAAEHLIQTGCQSLGLVHVDLLSEADRQIFREGLHGHKDAILRHRLDFDDSDVLNLDTPGADYSQWAACFAAEVGAGDGGPQEVRVQRTIDWLEAHPQLDGVVCYNDYLAGIVAEALRRLGRKVPDDVSIIARGAAGFQLYTPQPVTLLDVNLPEFGRKAYSLLRRMEAGETFADGYYETVDATLVVRGTTRPMSNA